MSTTTPPTTPPTGGGDRIERWRTEISSRLGLAGAEADRFEHELRGHLDQLFGLGLTEDEAFLVAEHRVRATLPPRSDSPRALLVPLTFAAAAGVAVKIATTLVTFNVASFGLIAIATLLALAVVLTALFAWLHRPAVRGVLIAIGASIATVAVTQTLYPYVDSQHTRTLAVLHLPIALAALLGTVYLGRDWTRPERWLAYLRYLGEALVFLALIAIGGGVLMGLTAAVFSLIGISPDVLIGEWVLPLGLGGAVIVALWLAEAKRGIAESLAPVLAAVFTPLVILLLTGFLVAMVATGRIIDIDRQALIVVDLVLAVVLGLHLFSYSSRGAERPAGLSDWLQLALVAMALVLDVVVLVAIAGRIGEYGSSPNKLAALGENILVAGILVGSLWLLTGFLTRHRGLEPLQDWHCRALWVIGGWAGVVVLLFPPLFGFR